MAAIANSPSFAKKAGVPMSVGKDFTAADKALKLPTSARSRADIQSINKPKTNQGRNELFKEGGNTMATKMNPGFMALIAKPELNNAIDVAITIAPSTGLVYLSNPMICDLL